MLGCMCERVFKKISHGLHRTGASALALLFILLRSSCRRGIDYLMISDSEWIFVCNILLSDRGMQHWASFSPQNRLDLSYNSLLVINEWGIRLRLFQRCLWVTMHVEVLIFDEIGWTFILLGHLGESSEIYFCVCICSHWIIVLRAILQSLYLPYSDSSRIKCLGN